ncbi:hypothetical protein MVEN_01886600 [Mycena venus]|uniref:Uncharacterized protein n=1 Tax=Mycena venus TaxID=2733690 RepID=A0A8H6XI47_9AGAR|nr:hypothetical protein MVEN_01886600 [Mycena venus]
MPGHSHSQSPNSNRGYPGWPLPEMAGSIVSGLTAVQRMHRIPAVSRSNATYKPPSAPRMPSVPLPSAWAGHIATPPQVLTWEPFPIDLRNDLDLEQLTRAIGNHRISPHSTIRVLPTARDRALFQITSGDTSTTSISIICRLCAMLRAQLSLPFYQSELSPDVQQAACSYFLSRSGSNGRRLWEDFLNGHHHPQGPKGEVLFQGHILLWGFRQEGQHRWIVDVDVQRRLPPKTHVNYSY